MDQPSSKSIDHRLEIANANIADGIKGHNGPYKPTKRSRRIISSLQTKA